jgi:hypothetical protein
MLLVISVYCLFAAVSPVPDLGLLQTVSWHATKQRLMDAASQKLFSTLFSILFVEYEH